MNFFKGVFLLITAVIVSVSCSSSKKVSREGSSSFGKVYYRNQVFTKNNNWDKGIKESQKLVLSGRKTGTFFSEEPESSKPLYPYFYKDPGYVHKKIQVFIDRFHHSDPEVENQFSEKNNQENNLSSANNSNYLSPDVLKWSSGDMIAAGGIALVLLSFMGIFLIKGIQKGFSATGILLISLLLFLGTIYIIFSASDIGSILI